jgi:preprotein translocase subunit YajC
MDFFLIQAAAAPAPKAGATDFIGMFVPIIAIIAVMYFFMLRPQSKKNKEELNFRVGLKKGDRVITIGGIHGRVDSVDETTVLIEVDSGVKLKMAKEAIRPLPDDPSK